MPFQSLYTKIFNGQQHHAESREWLQNVTQKYPYFSLAHFFLLKQTPEDNASYADIAGKTAIHFNNPFLLNEQLHQVAEPEQIFEPVIVPAEQVVPEAPVNVPLVEEIPVEPVVVVEETQQIQEINDTTSFAEINNELPSNNAPVVEISPAEAETLTEEERAESIAETLPAPAVNIVSAPAEIPEEALVVDSPVVQSAIAESQHINENEAPLFEPLFASDYFASQGIKLSEEQQPTDRMGKQLKSFTAWLKTMKKVHDPKLAGGDPTVDLAVQTLAEKSNKGEEVLTEAMAEVFLQQGKTNKAREIYEKLSLLNPSKSAYFAAKLEQIK